MSRFYRRRILRVESYMRSKSEVQKHTELKQKGSKLLERTSTKGFQGHWPCEASVPLGVLGQVKGRAGVNIYLLATSPSWWIFISLLCFLLPSSFFLFFLLTRYHSSSVHIQILLTVPQMCFIPCFSAHLGSNQSSHTEFGCHALYYI